MDKVLGKGRECNGRFRSAKGISKLISDKTIDNGGKVRTFAPY
jgi:hypothetical protein